MRVYRALNSWVTQRCWPLLGQIHLMLTPLEWQIRRDTVVGHSLVHRMYGAWDNVLREMLMELHMFTQMSKFGLRALFSLIFRSLSWRRASAKGYLLEHDQHNERKLRSSQTSDKWLRWRGPPRDSCSALNNAVSKLFKKKRKRISHSAPLAQVNILLQPCTSV